MSDVSEGAYDVFLTMANPEVTNLNDGTGRVTRSSVRQPPVLNATYEDDNDDGDDEEEDDDDDDDDGDGDGESDDDDDDGGEDMANTMMRASSPVASVYEDDDDDDDEDEQAPVGMSGSELGSRHPRSGVGEARSVASAVGGATSERSFRAPPPSGAFTDYLKTAPGVAKSQRDLQAEMVEKQSMITDLHRLRDHHGITLSQDWTMDDDFDDISFELKRLMLHVDEMNNISVMRNGLQLACTGIEMLSKRFKILDLEGWSSEACSDMSKYDRSLGRMYRKYWRRSHASSPEADIALSLVGSLGMYHMRRTMSKRIFSRQQGPSDARGMGGGPSGGMDRGFSGARAPFAPSGYPDYDDDDDDEALPP